MGVVVFFAFFSKKLNIYKEDTSGILPRLSFKKNWNPYPGFFVGIYIQEPLEKAFWTPKKKPGITHDEIFKQALGNLGMGDVHS